MPRCPNCGQKTERTEDWACQWCGYPLLSGPYKKIAKTYKQLKKEEEKREQGLPVSEEIEATPPISRVTLPPMPTPEPEPMPKPLTAPEPEPTPLPEAEAKPVPQSEPESMPQPEPESMPAAIEITVDGLLSAYETDAMAADERFANKIIRVTGVVGRREVKDSLGIYYIDLTSVERSLLQNVRCSFGKKHGLELEQLTIGQRVTVQGKYDGSIIDIRIRDCFLVV